MLCMEDLFFSAATVIKGIDSVANNETEVHDIVNSIINIFFMKTLF